MPLPFLAKSPSAPSLRSHSLKVKTACTRLVKMAYVLGAGAQMPTFLSLCQELLVSKVTLSTALAQLEDEEILYRRHGVGIFVAPDLRGHICLVCNPRFSQGAPIQEYWRLLVEEATRRVESRGYAVSLHFTNLESSRMPPLQEDFMDKVRAGRVQGVLGVALSTAAMDWLNEQAIPVVAYGSDAHYVVGMDVNRIVSLGVEAVAKSGCTKIGLWGTSSYETRHSARPPQKQKELYLFQKELASYGLSFSLDLVCDGNSHKADDSPNSNFEQGYEVAQRVFAQPRATWPNGVLVTNDEMTQGALTALQQMKIRVPHDVYIATHANRGSWALHAYDKYLALIEFDSGEIVQAMFDVLETLMRGEKPPQRLIEIEPKLKTGDALTQWVGQNLN